MLGTLSPCTKLYAMPVKNHKKGAQTMNALKSILFLFAITNLYSQDTTDAFDINAVRDYISKQDYLELFDTTYYRIQISDFLTNDIDGDSNNEIIVLTTPHYLQSATIHFYKKSNGRIIRISEGLAPGPLLPTSTGFLDAHSLGQAIDVVATDNKPINLDTLIQLAKKSAFGNFVAYKTFFHMDARKGSFYFIDMRHIAKTPGNDQTCEGFSFSKTIKITTGKYKNIPNCLFALTADGIYIYKIHSFLPNGLMNKSNYIYKRPFVISDMISNGGIVIAIDNKGTKHVVE